MPNLIPFRFSICEMYPAPTGVDNYVWQKAYNTCDTKIYRTNGSDKKVSKQARLNGDTRANAHFYLNQKLRKGPVEGVTEKYKGEDTDSDQEIDEVKKKKKS